MIGALAFWRKSTRLTQSAVIGAALILFVTWATTDWRWMIAPLVVCVGYTLLCQQPTESPHRHTIHAIACVGGIGLFWLCIWQVFGNLHSVYAYGVGYAANLGIIGLTHFARPGVSGSRLAALLKAMALCYWLMAIPYLIVWRHYPKVLPLAAGSLAILIGALTAFAAWQPSLASSPQDAARWTRQAAVSAASSVLAFLFAQTIE